MSCLRGLAKMFTSQSIQLWCMLSTFSLRFLKLHLILEVKDFVHKQCSKGSLGHAIDLSIVGVVLGLLVFISTTVTGKKGYGGAGINPTRCLGPALIRGGHLWDGHWIIWVGPTIEYGYKHLYIL
ncbi:hypothetical protein H5410_052517 [Solanum commersonii]|uniref:Uncharacterized protein n=1 Tax=Solanum commersonii TaxID=4109 RepID=A0A9J5X1P5_SOLCO|nr:hypothetical protein H5410_052517 [Solanum commersonii]